ncbi:SGNH/GDSL hydrolase family protein [Streptomyces sp. t39]|uniref:SGNH/GDSL hydrolase family protein n=1 Tax=Streptomyces sp. t39 TaxID=1828156 RepID=UPI0011CD3F68|nr:SGNH/GDSL hydrolase family protein [Streptomyces sp. t39]TXS44266.1 SGNH/GDSL hydrolase family protein [Streptomyces sp. t39]
MTSPEASPPALTHAGPDPTNAPAAGPAVWQGAWTTPVMRPSAAPWFETWAEEGFTDQSLRQVVRLHTGGTRIRIRLSNAYGEAPLHVTGAGIGRTAGAAAVHPDSMRTLRFNGSSSTTVPAKGRVVSDPVALPTEPLEQLTITLYFKEATGPATYHQLSMATTYRAAGDHHRDPSATAYTDTVQPAYGSWYYLEGVETSGTHRLPRAVVTFGDSITDGFGATIDGDDRYPDLLARRLLAAGRPRPVLNAGIGSNKLLTDMPLGGDAGIARFTRDVLDQPRVGTVVVLIGINDIQHIDDPVSGIEDDSPPATARQLIDGHRTLIRAAHARGVKAVGATLTPFRGAAGWTPAGEAIRGRLNEWISTSGAYDAVVDFAHALDPGGTGRIRDDLHIGDHLHPSPDGYRAMADVVDVAVLDQ